MKPQYFDQPRADEDDMLLTMAVGQGYVPSSCLLGGGVVMGLLNRGADPCAGCQGPRERCQGRPYRVEEDHLQTLTPAEQYEVALESLQDRNKRLATEQAERSKQARDRRKEVLEQGGPAFRGPCKWCQAESARVLGFLSPGMRPWFGCEACEKAHAAVPSVWREMRLAAKVPQLRASRTLNIPHGRLADIEATRGAPPTESECAAMVDLYGPVPAVAKGKA